MCRMLGLIATQPMTARAVLRDAPRACGRCRASIPMAGAIAIREPARMAHPSQHAVGAGLPALRRARRHRGHALVARLRQKTVGETALANTHRSTTARSCSRTTAP